MRSISKNLSVAIDNGNSPSYISTYSDGHLWEKYESAAGGEV